VNLINILVYATTASNGEESSYACYFDDLRQTYLGDLYSVNWMENSEKSQISKETLFNQFQMVKKLTNMSHVMEYGNLTLGKNELVTHFIGEKGFNVKPAENWDDYTPIVIQILLILFVLLKLIKCKLKRTMQSKWKMFESLLSRRDSKKNRTVSSETRFSLK
jgi:hypothetical protein